MAQNIRLQKKEIIGKSFSTILDIEGRKRFKKQFAHYKKTGEACYVEFNMICKNGTEIPVELNGKIEYDEKGGVIRAHSIFQSIHERKIKEKELETSENERRIWLENSPVCAKIIDLDSNLQYMSSAGIKMRCGSIQLLFL